MAAVSLAGTHADISNKSPKAVRTTGSSFWTRFLDRLYEARMRQAQRLIVMHGYGAYIDPASILPDATNGRPSSR